MTQPRLLMTFDDDTIDHWFAHRRVFDGGARVTFFVSHVDRLTDAQTDKLLELQRDGHTVASHGLRHLDAPRHVSEHGLAAYLTDEITPSIGGLAQRGLGARDFAYPFGRHDASLDAALTARFSWLRATSPRHPDARAMEVLVDVDDPATPRVLPARGIDEGRQGVMNEDDAAMLLRVLDEAARTGSSVCLFAHDIAERERGLAEGRNFITPDRVREVLTAAQQRGLEPCGFGVLPD